jgi:hypothetical protein
MGKRKATLFFPFILLIVLLPTLWAGGAAGAQEKVAQVVYITLSKACSCTLALCQAGDMAVGNVFNGSKQSLLKRIDYSTDKETARVYIKKYRVTQAPALLFLDAQGNLLWMAMGDLSEKDIADKMSQFGG